MGEPVYLEGEGALLPDGRFVPEANIRAAVVVLNDICNWINQLPPETRVVLEALTVLHQAEERHDG